MLKSKPTQIMEMMKIDETTQTETEYGYFCDIESQPLEQRIIVVRTHEGYNVSQQNLHLYLSEECTKRGQPLLPCFRKQVVTHPPIIVNEDKVITELMYEENDTVGCVRSKKETCNYLCVCILSALMGYIFAVAFPVDKEIQL
jgi:hypothetical protein